MPLTAPRCLGGGEYTTIGRSTTSYFRHTSYPENRFLHSEKTRKEIWYVQLIVLVFLKYERGWPSHMTTYSGLRT